MASTEHPDSGLLRQQRMEAVNRLAAGVAHEFNNVLQIVRGYVAFARDGLPEDSDTRDDLAHALDATDRAADLSRRLLQFARAEDDEALSADAADAIESLRLLLKPIIGENIQIETRVDPDLPAVVAGDASLRQALLNLCVNARDAMPAGGVLSLGASIHTGAADGDLVVGDPPIEPCVRVTVADTGEGMDEQTVARAFDPFFTTKQPGEGTGLGLPMVASLATRAGGCLRVDSRLGSGTRIDLYLPLVGPKDRAASETEHAVRIDPVTLGSGGGI